MPDLHARLLAEIERREEVTPEYVTGRGMWAERETAYLAALRGVVELCGPYDDMQVRRQTRTLANRTIAAVAEGLGVEG